MANYLYKAIIYKDPEKVGGIATSDIQMHKNAKDDFEANHAVNALIVTEILLSETTFVILVNYSQFEVYIDGTLVTWADVKYIDKPDVYELNLVTNNSL